MTRALLLVALVACGAPDLTVTFRTSDGPSQSCGSSSCSDVSLECDAVLNVRIISPDEPLFPHFSLCRPIELNADHDVCSIGTIDLEAEDGAQVQLPKEVLEVQLMIWPRSAVTVNDDGTLNCPGADVKFDAAWNFAYGPNAPALGGRGIYQPGDDKLVVTLGCHDLFAVNSCTAGSVTVTATVLDFDTYPVSVENGMRFFVKTGEPAPDDGAHVLEETTDLVLVSSSPTGWRGSTSVPFVQTACVSVLEDDAQETTTVKCRAVPPSLTQVDIEGVRLSKTSLDQILDALQLTAFPPEGITIGRVLDDSGNPAPGRVVEAMGPNMTPATVKYLSADRTSVSPGTTTTASGIFISQNAPYPTTFSTAFGPQSVVRIGGLIERKVTIVILQEGGEIGQ